MLELSHVDLHYGMIHALKDISLKVNEGEIVTLIGANGAGKTSTLASISGLQQPSKGDVTFNGKSIKGISAPKRVGLGLSHVPEGRHIFPRMTVYENLELGAYLRKDRAEIRKDIQQVYERFPRLEERKQQYAGTLSGGEQQMLAMGRALMSRPKMLLLDEPSMGLAPLLVKEIFEIVKDINAAGTTVLLVEQNAKMALSIAHRAYVIETGSIVLAGEAKDLMNSDSVKKAYLGG